MVSQWFRSYRGRMAIQPSRKFFVPLKIEIDAEPSRKGEESTQQRQLEMGNNGWSGKFTNYHGPKIKQTWPKKLRKVHT